MPEWPRRGGGRPPCPLGSARARPLEMAKSSTSHSTWPVLAPLVELPEKTEPINLVESAIQIHGHAVMGLLSLQLKFLVFGLEPPEGAPPEGRALLPTSVQCRRA